ncbi:hypothetical protein ACWC2K_36580 [Streptomyces chattanoogensis]
MAAVGTVTEREVHNARFPTSRRLDGSDAMNPGLDHSAAFWTGRTTRPPNARP